jgi:transcriptional regulator with XRE-family HTH domain
MDFGDTLKALREKAGMSQEKLARAANVSTSVVSKLEQKLVIDPAWSTIQRLARALGVDCTAFQMDDEKPEPETPPAKKTRKRKGE